MNTIEASHKCEYVHMQFSSCSVCVRVWTGTRSTSMWHKADISISTGITPSNSRRHGTTLSTETCIPVILRREQNRRHILSRQKTSLFLSPPNIYTLSTSPLYASIPLYVLFRVHNFLPYFWIYNLPVFPQH